MILDYKDIRFSFQSRKIRRRKKTRQTAAGPVGSSPDCSFAVRYVYEYRQIRKSENFLLTEKRSTRRIAI